jgi:putative heme-binding domain-containing protein
VCHKLDGVGQNVGPDLTALTDKSARSMLVAILDPNKAVEDKYLDYLAVTIDGRQLTGMVAGETSNSVTLTGQEAKQVTLLRTEIEMLQSSGKSLMPEGLEKDLGLQDLADVIAYVHSVSLIPKRFPGNQPELAHVRDDGSIRLLAMNAKIFGPKLVFEEKYRNLGYWQTADDYAVWMMQVPKAGKYQVRVEYACPDSAAGDRFLIAVGDQTLGGVVAGTGSWDRYRGHAVGSVLLPAGYAELIIRSDGPVRSALMDLRQIVLEPR